MILQVKTIYLSLMFSTLLLSIIILVPGVSGAFNNDCFPLRAECDPVVDLDLKDVELSKFLEAVAKEYGINMVISSEVRSKVSASLKQVELFDAIDTILSSRGYVRRDLGKAGLMIIEPGDEQLLKEQDLIVREFKLMYIDLSGTDILNTVEGILSPEGSVMPVRSRNALVVKDISIGVGRAEALIATMDKEPKQVIVEVKMVEIRKGSGSELGINWEAGYSHTSGNVFGGLGTVDGNVGVNLPGDSETLSDASGLLGLSIVSDRVSLDLRIQALETANEARTVSSPRVQVAENHRAVIADGTEIIIPSVQAQTVVSTSDDNVTGSTVVKPETFKAVLGLAVTPRVVAPGRVALEIEVMREWFDYREDKKVDGVPSKRTKNVSTSVFLETGQTIAIGGIETDHKAESSARVPFLSRIPLIGALFRSRSKEEDTRELVIFITPYIVGEDKNVAGTGPGYKEDL